MDTNDLLQWAEERWGWLVATMSLFTLWIARGKLAWESVTKAVSSLSVMVTLPFRIMERLDKQDASLSAIKDEIHAVRNEVMPNGGKSLRDVVEHIKEKMTIAEWRSRRALRHSIVPIFETDQCGQLIWSNNAFVELIGLPLHECLGTGWLSAIHPPSYQEETWDHWQECLSKNLPFLWELTLKNIKTGVQMRCRITASVLRTPKGAPIVAQGEIETIA